MRWKVNQQTTRFHLVTRSQLSASFELCVYPRRLQELRWGGLIIYWFRWQNSQFWGPHLVWVPHFPLRPRKSQIRLLQLGHETKTWHCNNIYHIHSFGKLDVWVNSRHSLGRDADREERKSECRIADFAAKRARIGTKSIASSKSIDETSLDQLKLKLLNYGCQWTFMLSRELRKRRCAFLQWSDRYLPSWPRNRQVNPDPAPHRPEVVQQFSIFPESADQGRQQSHQAPRQNSQIHHLYGWLPLS